MTHSTIGQVKERFGERFELVAPLADAGLAEAWRALDLTNRKSKLVKVFRPTARSPEAWSVVVARLRRMGNPRVPKVVEAGETPDGRRWVAYEPVKGRSLANWLEGHRQAGSAPGLGVALRVFNDAAAALQVGHGMPAPAVMHRGFSPLSLILERSGAGYQVGLLDHELAPFLGTDDTRSFKAPELLDPAGRPSAASDVFALAVVWLNLVAMRPLPHEGSPETWAEFVVRSPKAVKAHLASLRTDVPRDVWAVVEDALQPEAARRPQDANSFATKLRKAAPDAWRTLPQIEAEPPAPTLVAASVVPRDPRAASGGAVERWVAAERSPQEPAVPQHQAVPPVAGRLFTAGPDPRREAAKSSPPLEHATDVGTSTLIDAFSDEEAAASDDELGTRPEGMPQALVPAAETAVDVRPGAGLPDHIAQLVKRRRNAPPPAPHVEPAAVAVPAAVAAPVRVGATTIGLGDVAAGATGWHQDGAVASDVKSTVQIQGASARQPAEVATWIDSDPVATLPLSSGAAYEGGDTLDLGLGVPLREAGAPQAFLPVQPATLPVQQVSGSPSAPAWSPPTLPSVPSPPAPPAVRRTAPQPSPETQDAAPHSTVAVAMAAAAAVVLALGVLAFVLLRAR